MKGNVPFSVLILVPLLTGLIAAWQLWNLESNWWTKVKATEILTDMATESKQGEICLDAYLTTVYPRFLLAYLENAKALRQKMNDLRHSPTSSVREGTLLWLMENAQLIDAEMVKDSKRGELSSDRIQDWQITRTHYQTAYDGQVETYKSEIKLELNPDRARSLVLVLVTSLFCSSALALVLRNNRHKPLRDLLNECSLFLGAHDLRVPRIAHAGPEANLRASFKVLSDALQSVLKHEKAMVDNAVDMVCWLDPFGKFKKVSPSCQKLTGYTDEELRDNRLADYLAHDDATTSTDALHMASQSSDLRVFENWFRTKSGNTICLRWSAHWSLSENALFCIAHDVTENKLAEKLLKEKEAELRLLFESLPAGVVVVDEQMNIELTNSSIGEMLHHGDGELIGKNLSLILPDLNFHRSEKDENRSSARSNSLASTDLQSTSTTAVPPDIQKCDALPHEPHREPTAGDKTGTAEADQVVSLIDEVACTSTSERIPVQVAISKFATRPKWLLVVSDMRSRVAIETMKREFVAMVGHDLRTPLTSIKTFFDLLLVDGFHPETSQIVRMVADLERLMRLINDLLDVEKMGAGKFEVAPVELQITNLIEAACNAVEHIASVRKISINKETSDIRCLADGARTIQVLVNLLSNALKFSPKGSLIIVGIKDLNATHVAVYVKDQGRGVPVTEVERIFEKFSQVFSDDDIENGGSGLGLHICKTIVVQQGGEIWVEPNPEGGSTFYFSLRKAETTQ